MIDLHNHILPGIDDGARDLKVALSMAQQAVDAGVTKIVCTPHIHQGYFDNNVNTIKKAFKLLVDKLKQTNSPLKVAFAAEVRICPEITDWVKKEQIPFVGRWKGHNAMLLELPHSHVPPGTDRLIRWLITNSVQPIVVHPERNRDIMADYSKINMLMKAGAIFQVTAGSFCDRFAVKAKETALQMLAEDKIALIASDTHNTDRRPNDMGVCREIITSLVSAEKSAELLTLNPDHVSRDLIWV